MKTSPCQITPGFGTCSGCGAVAVEPLPVTFYADRPMPWRVEQMVQMGAVECSNTLMLAVGKARKASNGEGG